MEFIYELFPKEGLFANDGWLTVAVMIWGIIACLLAKPVLSWLFKSRSAVFRGKRANEQDVLNTLTAGLSERKDDFIVPKTTFDSFDAKNFGESRADTVQQYFGTGSYMTCTQDWDYPTDGEGEDIISDPIRDIYGERKSW